MNYSQKPRSLLDFKALVTNRQGMFLMILVGGLAAFETFNFATTREAFNDVLGGIEMLGIPWSTLLAVAFCGIDFAGIARLFTPQTGKEEPAEVWYLFGAWLLASGFNAILTWWGVSVAIATNAAKVPTNTAVDHNFIFNIFPVMIAIMVWVIRLLLIATFSSVGDNYLHHNMGYKPGLIHETRPQQTNFRPTPSYQSRPIVRPTRPVFTPPLHKTEEERNSDR